MSTKRISRIFCIGDLRSGRFCDLPILTLARFPYFATFASGGGGVGTNPPWRSAPDGRRASRKKPVDAPRRDLAIAHIFFLVLG